MKKILIKISVFFILAIYISTNCNVMAKEIEHGETEDNKKIIYLTFDDGPSPMTDKVLDILQKYNIKATFFLIGNQIEEQEDVVKRIHKEGHSIGLHTYTHKFNKIYCNNNAFIKEMKDVQEEINRVVGIKPNILRFPGGSRNHLSKEMLNLLHSNNFKVYDWNIDTTDGISAKTSPNELFKRATNITEDVNPNSIILLMHCDYMHKNTCKALPRIIEYYKQKGYEFKVITEETPEMYFPIAKKR